MHEVLYRRAQEAVDDNTPATPTSLQLPFATERGFAEVRATWMHNTPPLLDLHEISAASVIVVGLVGVEDCASPSVHASPNARINSKSFKC